MKKCLALMIGLGVVTAPALAQGKDARAAIKQADKEWLQAAAAKDVDRTVAFWTEDAVIQPPGQPAVVGKEAIRRYVSDAFKQPGFSILWLSGEPTLSSAGDMAYTLGTNQITFQDAKGAVVKVRGRGVVVWRRQRDGQWKSAVDTWNADAEPVPSAVK